MEAKCTSAPSSELGSSARVLEVMLIRGMWLLLASCPSCWIAPWGADVHVGTRDKSAWALCSPALLAHVVLGASILRASPQPIQLGGSLSCWAVTRGSSWDAAAPSVPSSGLWQLC